MSKLKLWFIFCLIILAVGLLAEVGQAGLTVAPRRFFFSIEEQNTNVVEVTNNSDQVTRVKVYPAQPSEIKEDWYLGDWLVVYPPMFNLEPGQQRVVRFSVRAPSSLEPGEYRSLLYFEQLPMEEEASAEPGDEPEVGFELLMRLGINLYGQVGELEYSGRLANPEIKKQGDNLQLKGEFVNEGTALLQTEVLFQLIDTEGKIVAEEVESEFVVHRGTSREYNRELDFSATAGQKLKVLFRQEEEIIYEFTEEL